MKNLIIAGAFTTAALFGGSAIAQNSDGTYNPEHSAARNWNEALLQAIRKDFARPTVHARNLFHSSALMYDVWAVYSDIADPYFLGNDQNSTTCGLSAAQKSAIVENA